MTSRRSVMAEAPKTIVMSTPSARVLIKASRRSSTS